MKAKDFFSVPARNYYYIEQNNKINGFTIKDHEKNSKYYSIAKTATTRSHYRVNRQIDDVAIASIDQEQNGKKYMISDETGTQLSEFKVVDSDTVTLTIGFDEYTSQVMNRGKQFEFKDDEDNLVMTIDKKLITLKDQYKVAFVEDFPALIAALVPIIIDDFYHLGTSN